MRSLSDIQLQSTMATKYVQVNATVIWLTDNADKCGPGPPNKSIQYRKSMVECTTETD